MKRVLVLAGLFGAVTLAVLALRLPRSADARGNTVLSAPRAAEPNAGIAAEGAAVPVQEPRRSEVEAPPSASVARVEVRVVTSRSFARDAEHVPAIAFQILRARAGEGVDVPVHPDDPPLATGRTGEDGQASLELFESHLFRDGQGRPRLRVRVVEPGYQQRFGGLVAKRPEDDPGEGNWLELKVMAVSGATARGRVVDPEGEGVDADVRLRKWIARQGVRKLGGLGSTRQLIDGWFEIDLREDVHDGVLLAEAGDEGTGALRGVELALADLPQDLRVVVSGPGRVRGRVVDAAGVPAAGVRLLVWLAEFDDEVGSFVSPEPAHSERRAEGGGRLWVTLESDERGGFDVRGLRRAPYVVRARTGQGSQSGYPRLLTREPVLADGTELELELSRPHLFVSLRDADGGEWTGAAAEVRGRVRWNSRVEAWPVAPTLVVLPCTPAGGEVAVQGDPLEGRVSGPGTAIFEVQDGARYLVGAQGGGFTGELRVVDVLVGAPRVPVELVAPAARELGSVSVRVAHAGRELNGRDHGEPEFDVYLETLDTAAVLLSRKENGPAPFVLTAPAGSYRVVAEGVPYVESYHGTLMTSRQLDRAEADIELQAGETRDLLLELGDGARVELTLMGAGIAADREAAVVDYPHLGEAGREAELAVFAARAKVFLLRPGRRPEPVYTKSPRPMGSEALQPRWPLGETHTSEVLPTGTYTLVARMPGGREVRATAELAPGTTTKVELEF